MNNSDILALTQLLAELLLKAPEPTSVVERTASFYLCDAAQALLACCSTLRLVNPDGEITQLYPTKPLIIRKTKCIANRHHP
jgi:hypothetical protein